MTTVNLKDNYGALGDGQIATRTLTIANGSKNLSVTADITATVGKAIAFKDGNGDGFRSTIATRTDAQHFVLADNFTGVSIAGAVTILEWGTADDNAIADFNANFVGQSGVRLETPAGRYPCLGTSAMGNFLGPGFGIPGFTMVSSDGNGAAVLTDFQGTGSFWLGGTRLAQCQNDTGSARVLTVSRNSVTLVLADPTKASRFTVNTWAMMTGSCLQINSGPSNPGYWEPVYITNKVGGTITVQRPLRNAYKSTWPLWDAGDATHLDEGGPATLYDLNTIPGYDCVHEYINMGLEQQGQINSIGRKITTRGGYVKGFGIYATLCQEWSAIDVDCSATELTEWDKLNGKVLVSGGTWHGHKFQSPSGDYEFNGVVTGNITGTPKRVRFIGATVGDTTFGPNSFGRNESVYAEDSTFTEIATLGHLGGVTEGDVTGAGAYTMTNGIISRVKSAGTGIPPQFANPGGYNFFGSRFSHEKIFRVVDVYEDGTNVHILTDQAGGFPAPIAPATTLSISTHPGPDTTFIGCSGCEPALGWSGAAAHRPMGSVWIRTYTGNIGTSKPVIPMIGKVVMVRITVNSAYSAGTFNFDDPFLIQMSDRSVVQWHLSIDLTATGIRTITPDGVPVAVGDDTGLALPGSGDRWMVPDQIFPKMSGATGSGSITLEIETDQGIPHTFGLSLV